MGGKGGGQKGPHGHAVVPSPDDRFLVVPDLGLDQFFTYRTEPAGALSVNSLVKVKPGSGPRHFAFHPRGAFAYGLNGMGSSVTAFSYDRAKGTLTEIQMISTLPAGLSGENKSAGHAVGRAGKLVCGPHHGY